MPVLCILHSWIFGWVLVHLLATFGLMSDVDSPVSSLPYTGEGTEAIFGHPHGIEALERLQSGADAEPLQSGADVEDGTIQMAHLESFSHANFDFQSNAEGSKRRKGEVKSRYLGSGSQEDASYKPQLAFAAAVDTGVCNDPIPGLG